MKIFDIIAEASGTFYHGTKADFDEFNLDQGSISFDRAVGAHFSATPELANRFALQNPGGTTRGSKFGGRVVVVTIPGEVYAINQGRTEDYLAITQDALGVLSSQRPDLMKKLHADMLARIQAAQLPDLDCNKYVDLYFEDMPALARTVAHYSNVELMQELARAYRQILVSQGYGVIQYTNTGKKEKKGLNGRDLESYIALVKPVSKFAKNT